MRNFTRFFVGLIIILGVFSSQELFAGIESSGWGEIKSQIQTKESVIDGLEPAARIIASSLTVSETKAGGMRSIITRQEVGGAWWYHVVGNVAHYMVFKEEEGGKTEITVLLKVLVSLPEDIERFGVVYCAPNGQRIRSESRFFEYDEEGKNPLVRFTIPYNPEFKAHDYFLDDVGDPGEGNFGKMSLYYIREMPGVYDILRTRFQVQLMDVCKDADVIILNPIVGGLPSGEIDPNWEHSAASTTTSGFFFNIRREPGIRFFRLQAWNSKDIEGHVGEWIVQLPFIGELDVQLSHNKSLVSPH